MSGEKCILDPQRECHGVKAAEEVAGDLKDLDRRLSEFQQSVSTTTSRFGGRIGSLEAANEVQKEQRSQMKEQIAEVKKDVAEFRREQKDSIAELRRENKESMEELKRSNKEILDAVSPLKHKVETLEHLSDDVSELKEKPGETWEHIKKQGIGWIVALLLALVAAALGLSKFT